MTQPYSNYIAGEWLPGSSVTRDINPSDLSDVVGEYAQADAKQVDQAIAAARAAAPGWAAFNTQARADILDKIGNEILARKEELGKLLSRELAGGHRGTRQQYLRRRGSHAGGLVLNCALGIGRDGRHLAVVSSASVVEGGATAWCKPADRCATVLGHRRHHRRRAFGGCTFNLVMGRGMVGEVNTRVDAISYGISGRPQDAAKAVAQMKKIS